DREFSLNGRAILANRAPIRHQGRVIGAIATFRDKSEVNALAEQLTGVSRYAEALRAATHEFKNKLHVLLGLAQMGDLDAL
ncbi:MAG TPA: histidine kinase, partial [Pseudomonas sp.]|nr:histidine kinase [Pseudomonas sp.]